MSTKTNIQNLINTNLADASSITASEHRAVENALLNELYPTPIYESSESTNTITSKNSAIATNLYGVSIVKQGRLVTISGYLTNNSFNILNNSSWFFEIINSEYFPDTTVNPIIYRMGNNRQLIFTTSNKRFGIHNCDAGLRSDFQITYSTLN